MVKVFSIPKGTALKGKNSLPLGANSFLGEVLILKRDAIEENQCCSSSLPLMCVTFSVFWLRHWLVCTFGVHMNQNPTHLSIITTDFLNVPYW